MRHKKNIKQLLQHSVQVKKAARKSCSSVLFKYRSNTKGQNEPEAAVFLGVGLDFWPWWFKTLLISPVPTNIYHLHCKLDFKKARVPPETKCPKNDIKLWVLLEIY